MQHYIARINELTDIQFYGRITALQGLLLRIGGVSAQLSIGSRLSIETRWGKKISAEVIGFEQNEAVAMPFDSLEGVGVGCIARIEPGQLALYPDRSWLGRVINGLGEPLDKHHKLLSRGDMPYALRAAPPPAHIRNRVSGKIDLGIRALNTFVTCCQGQRMGIFAGSGVGKSVLLSMMARYTEADVNVIGLIGERGREVQEFLEDDLGVDGLQRSVVIVSTSDEPALKRRQAAYATMAVAEYFRDQGLNVLCLMDSVTRFAMAQREIGLAGGEPPASKGYTPTVFSELPKLLERAGPGTGAGSITGLFTVLVEGDDHNEPIADAVRGILDGHIVLERQIAERGRFPAINILKSISRTMPACNTPEETEIIRKARSIVSTYENMSELIRIGAYRRGTDPAVDTALFHIEEIEDFLRQNKTEKTNISEGFSKLSEILERNVEVRVAQ